MNIGVLLSIREKSKRFPGKVLKQICGQTVTEHLIDRIKMAEKIDRIIIATSVDPRDGVFTEMAEKKGIEIFRGSEEDKLKRYLDASDLFGLDAVIIIDGDDILCFPEFIDKTADILRENTYDAVFWKGLPLGAASSGLTKQALQRVLELKNEDDTEVWGGYFTQGERFQTAFFEPDDDIYKHPEIRMTLDYQEDYDFFKAIYDELYEQKTAFTSFELMTLLVNRKPEIVNINLEAQKKYEQHLTKAVPVRFKEEVPE